MRKKVIQLVYQLLIAPNLKQRLYILQHLRTLLPLLPQSKHHIAPLLLRSHNLN